MKKINLDGKEFDVVDERSYGQNISDRRKEILFRDPVEKKTYLLMSSMGDSANAGSSTKLFTERNTVSVLTEEQVDSWKNGNFEAERKNLTVTEVVKEMIIS